MSIEALNSNIAQERYLVEQLESMFIEYSVMDSPADRQVMEGAIMSIQEQLKILNNSLVDLINNVKLSKKLPGGKSGKKSNLVTVSYKEGDGKKLIALNKKDKDKFLQQLHISSSYLKELRKKNVKIEKELEQSFKSPNPYIQLANKFFIKVSNKQIKKGNFSDLKLSLQKGGFVILLNSYISVTLFTTLLALFFALFFGFLAIFLNVSLTFPFISFVDFAAVNMLARVTIIFTLICFTPVLVFFAMMIYPSTEKASIESLIDSEMPFSTIQMAAIAGANIEPSNIFRIIALSKEYPNIRREAKKLLNQINLYGYSLVVALRNSAMTSPSKSWADLLNGVSTTIRSGGKLSRFLSKRADTLLFEYRLKREKATKFAETFMDIYISVVIAAPMLIMLLLVMMSVSGLGVALSPIAISLIIVSIVAASNLVFLMFLHLNQGKM